MENNTSAADSTTFANMLALGNLQSIASGQNDLLEDSDLDFSDGHKFGLPTLPIPSTSNIKHRYDPIVDQVTNLIMEHGKKSAAQRVGLSVDLFPFLSYISH